VHAWLVDGALKNDFAAADFVIADCIMDIIIYLITRDLLKREQTIPL